MRLNIDERLWAEYESKLRDAYTIYYDALKKHGVTWFVSKHPDTSESERDKLKKLIDLLPHPDQASPAEMIIIGWWGTSWHYESFYWCGKDGQTPEKFAQTALHDLSMLTYHNKDLKLRPLIETVTAGARFADNIGGIVGKWHAKPT